MWDVYKFIPQEEMINIWIFVDCSPEPLQIEQYYIWFRFAVTQWISVAQVRAVHRIHKAIELDKVRITWIDNNINSLILNDNFL